MLKKDKGGVSVLIGYVLLIVFAIIIGSIVFAWLKTYVPSESLSCPDSVSIFLREASYNDSSTPTKLKLVLVNNGRFDVAGYFIHATNSSSQAQPVVDLSGNIISGGNATGNSVLFSAAGGNVFSPGDERTSIFDVSFEPYSIRVIPVRFQEEEGRERFVSCGDSRILQLVGEPFSGFEEPVCGNSMIEGTEECDDGNTISGDGCSSSCTIEESASCNNNNIKESGEACDGTDLGGSTCQSLGYDGGTLSCNSCNFNTSGCFVCGDGTINSGEQCDDGNVVSGDGCSSQCITEFCGDGMIQEGIGEQCDDGNTVNNDGCENDCTLSLSTDCSNNCLLGGYAWGYCATQQECGNIGGNNPFSGNTYCGAGQGRCCCTN